VVAVADLSADDQLPGFGPAALAAGMAAVFTFPMRHGDRCVGALNLYRDALAGPLSGSTMRAAQTLADVAAAYVLHADTREQMIRNADRFRDRSLHDTLTGLPNRYLLQERIEHASHRAQRTRTAVAVLFIDLDHFKHINDAYGHCAGDQLLIAVAARLTGLVRPGDTLARVAGDEFVFLCEDLTDTRDIDGLVDRISGAFSTPFTLTALEIAVTASLGIAYSGPGELVTDDLVQDADIAMHQAKRRGGANRQVINQRLAEQAHDRDHLERDLRVALAHNQLDVAYQPIVRLADGAVTGVEALLRWTRPGHGPVPAQTTVAIAEQCGLIAGIGAWVLARSCQDWMTWIGKKPGRHLDLSVNVSPQQLMAPGFISTVTDVLAATAMDPACLVLEVTETIFIEDDEHAMTILDQLKALGIRLALDDFGTGYSSLTHLRRFPVDIVKIDRSFVCDVNSNPAATTMVAAVTHLAHDLGKIVTAEGVDSAAQCDQIVAAGCESAQGFYFAHPMTAHDFYAQLV